MPYVPPWIHAATPGEHFAAGVDLYLQMQQAKARKQQADLMAQYRAGELANTAARLQEQEQHHRELEQNNMVLTQIKQQLADANTAAKAARTQQDRQNAEDRRAALQARLDQANKVFTSRQTYLDKTLALKNAALDEKKDYDAGILGVKQDALSQALDLAGKKEQAGRDVASQRKDEQGWAQIYRGLVAQNSTLPPEKQIPQAQLADKAMDVWESQRQRFKAMNPAPASPGAPQAPTPPTPQAGPANPSSAKFKFDPNTGDFVPQ